ncbi:MAG: type II toxin-antitoxin system Phd/YefM family antitoxin [Vicinamibacterales bacterium]
MSTVGIRELRASLSRYLRRVRRGEIVDVTDHGELVARIIPATVPENVAQLLAEGRATWSGRRFTAPTAPVRLKRGAPTVAEAIAEDRR